MIINYSLEDYLERKRSLSPEELALADSLVWDLRDEWMYRWHRTWERGLTSEIILFGEMIKNLGEERSVSLLVLYGRELVSAARNFDIYQVEKYMTCYPDIIKILGGQR